MHTVFNNIHSLLNKKIDSIFALLDVFKLLQSLVYMSYNKNVTCQNIRETEQQTSLKHEIFTHCHSTVIVIALVSFRINSQNRLFSPVITLAIVNWFISTRHTFKMIHSAISKISTTLQGPLSSF